MNIFVLNLDPVLAAQDQCDKTLVKMVLETGQMLSTAHRVLDNIEEENEVLYKISNKNHPCNIWVRESEANYNWLYQHFIGLADEYTYRYGKVHSTDTRLREVLKTPPRNIPKIGMTPFRLAMESHPEFKGDDPVKSYRKYYTSKKDRFNMKWTKRDVPQWFLEQDENLDRFFNF